MRWEYSFSRIHGVTVLDIKVAGLQKAGYRVGSHVDLNMCLPGDGTGLPYLLRGALGELNSIVVRQLPIFVGGFVFG